VVTPIKVVVTGDNHLNLYSQKLGSKLEERRKRIGQAWRQTIDYSIKEKVDLYLNTGDLFDQLSPRNPPRARVVEAFKDLQDSGVQAYIIAGNHEAPASQRDGASPHTVLSEAGLARVFECYQIFEQDIINIKGTEISIAGLSYNRNLGPKVDPIKDLTIPGSSDINIAMLHYSIERIAPPIWEEPIIKISSIEKNSHIHLYAMGHIHNHVNTKIKNSHILYPGGTERYNFGESNQTTGFCRVKFNPEVEIEYIRTEPQYMRQIKLHTSMMNPNDPTSSAINEIEKNSNNDGLLQLVLEGEIPFERYTSIDFPKILSLGNSQNFYFEYLDFIRPIVKGLEFKQGSGLNPRKELEEIASKAMEDTSDEERKIWEQAAEYALSYYIRSREGR
jgi:DNA repair exonuclease SbcCD nuclease subunit